MADKFITELDALTTFTDDNLLIVENTPGGTPETIYMDISDFVINLLRRTNYLITRTIASNNLTVGVKDSNNADATSTKALTFHIAGVARKLIATLSVTVNAGANTFNLGSVELYGQQQELFVYAGWRASTSDIFIVIARHCHAREFADFSGTATNESYGAYSGSAPAATDPVTVIGRVTVQNSGTASYNWSIPTQDVIIHRPIYETSLLSYVPAWSANASMTYTTVTTTIARYQVIGRRCKIFVRGSGTIGGTPNVSVLATLPFESALIATAAETGTGTGDTVFGRVFISAGTPDVAIIQRYDGANWTAGTRVAVAEIEYWI